MRKNNNDDNLEGNLRVGPLMIYIRSEVWDKIIIGVGLL